MKTASRGPLRLRARSAPGFSLIELLMVVAIVGVLAAIAIGVTPAALRTTKGAAAAQQLSGFIKRTRELAISRRRTIEIVFTAPSRVQTFQRAVPNPPAATPAPTLLETMYLEGQLEFRIFGGVTDTLDAFATGFTGPINVGPNTPLMFTSEGSLVDVNGDPFNATLFLGVPNQISTANAITVLGTTALVRNWRWDGSKWVNN
jgi:prepilin-type N-terminal cleavage/methylation domain-containing protein